MRFWNSSVSQSILPLRIGFSFTEIIPSLKYGIGSLVFGSLRSGQYCPTGCRSLPPRSPLPPLPPRSLGTPRRSRHEHAL